MSKTTNKFSPEVRAQAVRLVLDHADEHPSRRAAVSSIAAKIGCNTYVRSRRAGKRIMASVSRFLTKKVQLKFNEAKSAVARTGASGASRQRPSTNSRR